MGARGDSIRVAIIASGDPQDQRYWSGLGISMVRALERHFELVHVERCPWPRWHPLLVRLVLKLTGGRRDIGWYAPYTRLATLAMRRRLARANPDLVFALSAGELILALGEDFRVVNVADATGPLLTAYYPAYAAMAPSRRQAINAGSLLGVRRALLSIFPSAWACEATRSACGLGSDEVVEAPFGANLDAGPIPRARVLDGPLRLLFVGYDWQRKGGDLVSGAVRQLVAEGLPVRLDVVGCNRPASESPSPAIRFHGRIDKAQADQRVLLQQLYGDAHLFVMPTRAEAFGVVFAEAAAHGVPSIALRTGGVPSAVRHGETGWLLEPDAGVADLVAAIRWIINNPTLCATFSANAMADAASRLNWDTWGRQVALAVQRRLDHGKDRVASHG
ncbi:glycosyltransferase family 4 protein [Alteraurantiacibacter buctensis]|uniref:Glycosyltransferase n=1 Tax=Alteraurantiacibacter buctensis TaxID=1503981 RepID=A0A844YYU0_9SPHN|nr:glycosyltransferase family 4 protein [Alteraurantiacibacter buctensis]MXO72719.1 glycosyltransferase [Alteraurantiacibacter buctensis]